MATNPNQAQVNQAYIGDNYLGYNVIAAGSGTTLSITATGTSLATLNVSLASVIPAPPSGPTLTIDGVAGGPTLIVNSANGATGQHGDVEIIRAGSTANVVADGPNIEFSDTTGGTTSLLQQSGGQTELWQYNAGWHQIWYTPTNGGLVLNETSSGNTLTVLNDVHAYAAYIQNTASTGNSLGLHILAGTNASDYSLVCANSTGTTNLFTVDGLGDVLVNGGLTVGASISVASYIGRQATAGGYMNGGYSTIETGATAGAIYTIGGPYLPNGAGANPLGSMYGIGFTNSETINGPSGTTSITTYCGVPGSYWGQYVASDGTASIFLSATDGGGYFYGPVKASFFENKAGTFNIGGAVTSYGTTAVGGSAGAYSGFQFTSAYENATLMVSTTTQLSGVYQQSNSAWQWYVSAGALYGVTSVASQNWYPVTDDAFTLGASGHRWSVVWAATGTIDTSDGREKTEIAESALGLSFINRLHPVSYKWKNGGNTVETTDPTKSKSGKPEHAVTSTAGSRTHYGLISQEVKAAVDAETPNGDFGGWVLTDKNDPNSQQGLRYSQFIAPLIKAVQELSAQNTLLKAEIAEIKDRLHSI